MKRKNLLFKSLLVAAGLCVGASAWAAETPYTITSSESAYVDATDDQSKAAIHNGATLTDLVVYGVQVRNWQVNGNTCNAKFSSGGKMALYKFPLSSIKNETGNLKSATLKVTINSTGDGKNVTQLGIFGYNGSQDWTGATLTYNNLSNSGANALGYTVDYSGSYPILDANSQNLGGGANAVVSVSAVTYVQSAITANRDYVSFAVSNNSIRTTNLNVTATLELVFSSATATTYTIEFKNAGGNELKSAVNYDIFEGESFTASASDMASFFNSDFTKKYVYASGNETKTAVAEASSNVITLVFDETDNAQYTYSVNAIGSLTKEGIATATIFEGQTTTIYYNKYIQDESGNWHFTNTNGNSGNSISYGVSVSGAGSTNKTFSAADITDFIEVENMNKSRNWATEGTATRASNGKAPRIAQNGYAFTEPIAAGGTFTITLGGRGVANGATVDLYVGTKKNSTSVENMTQKGTFSSWSNGGIAEISIENVVLEPGQVIVLKNPSESNNCYVEADYIYIKKTADYTIPVAVAENKEFATFNSDYALDFTNVSDIIAYTAKVSANGSEVTMTKVEGKVPANTGLLIRKAQNEATEVSADVPVVASAAAVDNDFIAVTAANCDEGQEYKTVTKGFILATLNGVQDFYKANSTEGTKVAKGKAYLPATGATASRMMMKFGEYTTGISEMRTVTVDNNVYNMNGVRVAQPQKGLYIVNGKKVVIK